MKNPTQTHALAILAVFSINLSMLAGLCGTVVSIVWPDMLFSESMQMYGPMKNNLVFIWLYIGITEVALFVLQFYKHIINESLMVGLILVLVAFGTIIYSQVNQLPLSNTMFTTCLAIATGHLIYYFIYQNQLDNKSANN
ncbi:MAG: hypothetical protein K0U68_06345 [Gammaproteobacteria bacterium]|nr:hypothetical protein [Gammaproteobacteria bacterium]